MQRHYLVWLLYVHHQKGMWMIRKWHWKSSAVTIVAGRTMPLWGHEWWLLVGRHVVRLDFLVLCDWNWLLCNAPFSSRNCRLWYESKWSWSGDRLNPFFFCSSIPVMYVALWLSQRRTPGGTKCSTDPGGCRCSCLLLVVWMSCDLHIWLILLLLCAEPWIPKSHLFVCFLYFGCWHHPSGFHSSCLCTKTVFYL